MSRPLKLCNAHSGRCTLACNKHLASPVVFLQSLHCKYTVKLCVIFLNGTLRIETKFCFMSLHALKFSQSNADVFPFPVHSGTYIKHVHAFCDNRPVCTPSAGLANGCTSRNTAESANLWLDRAHVCSSGGGDSDWIMEEGRAHLL